MRTPFQYAFFQRSDLGGRQAETCRTVDGDADRAAAQHAQKIALQGGKVIKGKDGSAHHRRADEHAQKVRKVAPREQRAVAGEQGKVEHGADCHGGGGGNADAGKADGSHQYGTEHDVHKDRGERGEHRRFHALLGKEQLGQHFVCRHKRDAQRKQAEDLRRHFRVVCAESVAHVDGTGDRLGKQKDADRKRQHDQKKNLNRRPRKAACAVRITGRLRAGELGEEQVGRHKGEDADNDDIEPVGVAHHRDAAAAFKAGGVARVDDVADRLQPGADEDRQRQLQRAADIDIAEKTRGAVAEAEPVRGGRLDRRLQKPAEHQRRRQPPYAEFVAERVEIEHHHEVGDKAHHRGKHVFFKGLQDADIAERRAGKDDHREHHPAERYGKFLCRCADLGREKADQRLCQEDADDRDGSRDGQDQVEIAVGKGKGIVAPVLCQDLIEDRNERRRDDTAKREVEQRDRQATRRLVGDGGFGRAEMRRGQNVAQHAEDLGKQRHRHHQCRCSE